MANRQASTVREQWKYRLAVWQQKMAAAKQAEAAADAAVND
jgi:hypothetical protein